MTDQASVPRFEGVGRHFFFDYLFEQFGHFYSLRFIVIKGVPSIIKQLLQFFRAHKLWLVDYPVGGKLIPVFGDDAVLPVQFLISFGMRKGRQHGEFGKIEFDLQEKIDEAFNIFFGMAVKSEEYGAFHHDAVIVVALDPFFDLVGGIENRLVNVPGPGLGRQVENLGFVFNGMRAPVFFQGDHFSEEIHFPFAVLRKGVIDNK